MRIRFQYFIIIVQLVISISCSNVNDGLISALNDTQVDLTDLDSVKHYLNGYWLLKGEKTSDGSHIFLRLDFSDNDSSTVWEKFEYKKNLWSESKGTITCEPILTLTERNDSIMIRFTGMTGSSIDKIDYLSKTTLIIHDVTYQKHTGTDIFQ